MWTIVLLLLSNVFMTIAWYGHLKLFPGEGHPLWIIVLTSWGIALFEYCLAVPANRIGMSKYGFEPSQLKTIQEIVTLIVFAVFSATVLKEKLRWNHAAGFACIALAGLFIFNPFARKAAKVPDPAAPATAPAAVEKPL